MTLARLGARLLAASLVVAPLACGPRAPAASPAASTAIDARVPSADGVPIHYVAEGAGPAVVLLHCLGCDLHYWDGAAADLARDHRAVRLDFAGHGGSGAGRKAWSVDAFVADVRAVVDAAGVDRFVVVGHSMSGPIALEVARQLGDRVMGVVPVDSVLDVDDRMSPEQRAAAVAKMRGDYRATIEALLLTLVAKRPDPAVVARVRRDALAMDPDRAASILDAIFAYRADLALDALSVPILAIDSDARPVAIDHDRAHAPQFGARVIAGTGHWLMLDAPDELARALRDAVTSIESGRAARRRA